jgi:hypothetical protein
MSKKLALSEKSEKSESVSTKSTGVICGPIIIVSKTAHDAKDIIASVSIRTDECLESMPCQHIVRITYIDGRVEQLKGTMYSDDIIKQYGKYLSESNYKHCSS